MTARGERPNPARGLAGIVWTVAARFNPAARAGRLVRTVKTNAWGAKAKGVAGSLKAQYDAGKEGDESPTTPIWPTPKDQLDNLLGLLRSDHLSVPPPSEQLDADTHEVADALRGIDWAAVRSATAARTNDVSRAMRSVVDQVDWTKVQPVAAQVSRALIAAAASGQIGLGGRLGSNVARAIVNRGGLADHVAANLHAKNEPLPAEFRKPIDTTAVE
jgi:hypothetical protein